MRDQDPRPRMFGRVWWPPGVEFTSQRQSCRYSFATRRPQGRPPAWRVTVRAVARHIMRPRVRSKKAYTAERIALRSRRASFRSRPSSI